MPLNKYHFFSSLSNPNYRLFLTNIILQFTCTSMQDVLMAWLILDLSGSNLLFSFIMSLRFIPMLMGPISGVVADYVDRHKILMIFKITQIADSLILGTLILGGSIQLWQVTMIIIIQSIIGSFNLPAETAFSLDLVDEKNVTNVTALERISMNLSGLLGPVIVGVFVNISGIGPFFYLNAVFYLIALIFLIKIKSSSKKQLFGKKSVSGELIEGFRYSWYKKSVFGGQLIYLFGNMFPIACNRTLMWLFAKDILKADASTFGWLSAGSQLGSFLTSISIAQLGNIKGMGKVAISSSLIWGIMWILFSLTSSIPIALIYLILMGIVSTLTMMLGQVIILMNTEPEIRGRVMGIRSLAISSQFAGSLISGFMAQTLGSSMAMSFNGISFIISMLIITKFVPSLRKA